MNRNYNAISSPPEYSQRFDSQQVLKKKNRCSRANGYIIIIVIAQARDLSRDPESIQRQLILSTSS